MIRKASKYDLEDLVQLSKIVKRDMQMNGIHQWGEDYPSYTHFENDFLYHGLFVYESDGFVIASISALPENDPSYQELTWSGTNAMVIHRLMVHPFYMNQQVASQLMQYVIDLAIEKGKDSIKIDTHPDNYRMQKFILKWGFVEIGYLSSINRIAYEKQIK